MKEFKVSLKIAAGDFFKTRNIICMMITAILALYFVQAGIGKLKKSRETKNEFQKIERMKIDMYPNITYYGSVGFRILSIPGPSMVFFSNAATGMELISQIDSGDILSIHNSTLGANIFSNKIGGFKDFTGIILFFGSILALYFGYESTRKSQYLKFLSSISSAKRVFLDIILTRIILIALFLVFVTACSLLLAAVNNIDLSSSDYLHIACFLPLMILVIIFFYACGALIGTIESKGKCYLAIFLTWFFLIYLIPEGIGFLVSKKAEQSASNFKVELEKLKVLTGFENWAINEEGKFDLSKKNTKAEQDIIEHYWNTYFKRIQELDKKQEDEMRSNNNYFQKLSLFFPSTFYLSTANGMSGGGYDNVIEFYRYARRLKHKFTRFYLDKKFYTDQDKVEDFITGDENVFIGTGVLIVNFGWGVLLAAVYSALLLLAAFYLFKRNIWSLPENDAGDVPGTKIKFGKEEVNVWKVRGNRFGDMLSAFFAGGKKGMTAKGFKEEIILDDVDISATKFGGTFIYICPADSIPGDTRVGDLISLVTAAMKIPAKEVRGFYEQFNIPSLAGKKFKQLGGIEKGGLLLALTHLKSFDVYLIDRIGEGLPDDFIIRLNDRMEELQQGGATAIYLTPTYIGEKIGDIVAKSYTRDVSWHYDIKRIKQQLENDKK